MSNKTALNSEQKDALEAIKKFIKHPVANTFVLKGYAGTGKTFLMQQLAAWLHEKEHKFSLLAATGRAATVLRGKTGFEAKTVHGELYQFSKVNDEENDTPDNSVSGKNGQMTLQFSLRKPDETDRVYIVDEASMLASDIFENDSFATFGSGQLLDDFFDAIGNNKVIFVGDPCQLPPVGQSFSPALDTDWLSKQGRVALTLTLTQIERTQGDNDILKLATGMRNLSLMQYLPKYPKLPAKNLKNVTLYNSHESLFEEFTRHYKKVGVGGTLAIARSNRLVQTLNNNMRSDLYGSHKPLQINDILLVTQNNYKVPLTNGDFVITKSLGEIHTQAGLRFQDVKVAAALSGQEHELLLSLDILYGTQPNFTKEQMKSLMIDFNNRMRAKKIEQGTERYRAKMMEDEYLNCLKATYGYAVTCHKSQGGEWDDVFLFLDKSMYGMPPEELCRWLYTAVTRVKQKLHLLDDWWVE